MPGRAIPVLALSLFGLFATSAAAEPVRITSGSVFNAGIGQIGTLDIQGTQGFSLTGSVDNASNAFQACSVPECVEGTALDLFFQLGGPLLLDASATLNGVSYPFVDGDMNAPAYTYSEFHGMAFAPAVVDGPQTTTAPFTFNGGFYLMGTGLLREIAGGGTATLFLRPYGATGLPPSWFIEGIRYNFTDQAPVPEPATLTLTATALAGAYLARRRGRA